MIQKTKTFKSNEYFVNGKVRLEFTIEEEKVRTCKKEREVKGQRSKRTTHVNSLSFRKPSNLE